jgi:hypothetical protein
MNTNLLVSGAVYGAVLTLVAIAIPRYTRHLLLAALVVAAASYVYFALDSRASLPWLAVELAGVAVYGYAAVRGVRGSAWWLVAGLALHPVWDVALHYAGPGRAFAPDWYTTWCLTYDLMSAALAAIAILIGTHLTAAPLRTPAPIVSPLRSSTCSCPAPSPSCTATGARAA